MELRVISIGTLSQHPLWEEQGPARAAHATTSLIRVGKKLILVDPGLPEQVISARLLERAGLRTSAITHVFLTCFRPDVWRGITAFDKAQWWVSLAEREGMGVPLVGALHKAVADGDEELKSRLELDVAVLNRCEPAPDRLAPGVDLFPLPGVTPGLTGLLVSSPKHSTLVCGDAIPTIEHLERGQVLQTAANVAQARESFAEAIEIADYLVPGRDNFVVNPTKRPF